MMLLVLLIVCSGVLHSLPVKAAEKGFLTNIQLEEKLRKKIFENYTYTVRPSYNRTSPVMVTLHVYALRLNYLSTHFDLQNIDIWQYKSWRDPRLTWNSSEYGGISYLRIDIGKLWYPDITVIDSVAGGVHAYGLATVESGGYVHWNPFARYLTHCDIDVSRFPFDTQTCDLNFGSWSHMASEIHIANSSDYVNTWDMVANREWALVKASAKKSVITYKCCPEDSYVNVTVTFQWKRVSTMARHMLVMPSTLLAILCPFVFLLPPNSMHKITLGISIILSMLVLELTLMDWLPLEAPTLPIVAVYFMLTMAMATISLVVSVIVINLSDRGPRTNRVPLIIRKVMLQGLKRLVLLGDVGYPNLDDKYVTMAGLANPVSEVDNSPLPPQSKLDRDTDYIGKQVNTLASRSAGQEILADIQNEWRLLGMVVDRLMFVAYIIIFVLSAMIIFS